MIQELREYSQSLFFRLLLLVIAVTLVISFGVGSFFGERKEVLATVNGQDVLLKDFQRAYQNQMENLRRTFGDSADKLAEQLGLRNQVLQQLVDQALLVQAAETQGLLVTDLELQEYIRQQPFFQKDGQFDYETYTTILNQNRIPLNDYEDSSRHDLLVQKQQALLGAGLFVSAAEVEQAYLAEHEQVEVAYLYFDPKKFLDKVEVSDAELASHHEANPNDFQSQERFKIEYVVLPLDLFRDTAKVKEREMRRYFERNREQYTTPPEVRARHLLFKVESGATEDQIAERKAELNVVRERVAQGESFEELAKELSEDFSASQGGDLGWFKPGEMVPAFETAAFSLESGQLSEVVTSPFGLHLILVEERKDGTEKALEDVRAEITEQLADRRAEKVLAELLEHHSSLGAAPVPSELATTHGGELKSTDWFERNTVVEGFGSAFSLVPEFASKQPGDFGAWKRNPMQGHLFYKLLERETPKPLSLFEAKEQVAAAVRLQKASVLAKQTAQQALEGMDSGAALETLAKQHGLEIETAKFTAATRFLPKLGENLEFRKAALRLTVEQPFALSETAERVDLMLIKGRMLDAEQATTQRNQVRMRLEQTLHQAMLALRVKQLRQSATVEVINPLFTLPNAS